MKFSRFVELETVSIIGGEPLQHPQIITIIKDIRSFFPNSIMKIWTNGLLLDKIPNLKKTIIENNVQMVISVHNKKFRKNILKKVNSLFGGNIKFLKNKHIASSELPTFQFQADNKPLMHEIRILEHFYQNSLDDPYNLRPHESDPALAWNACYSKCPTIAQGKFHKCPISHCMPVAVKQRNDIEINSKQKTLIDSFPYIECKDIDKVSLEYWTKFLNEKIDQCSLCPEKFVTQPNGIQQLRR